MKAGWEVKPLGEVCSLIKRGIAPKYIETGGIVVINQKCIRDHRIDFNLARRNDLERKIVPDERLIQIGDVLVNSTGTGTLGRVAQVRLAESFPATVDTHVTIVRPSPGKFFAPFFGYMMRMIEDEIAAAGQGVGGQTELSREALTNSFMVSYPDDLEEQKRIVAVLDAAFEGLTRAKENAEANLQNARELFKRFIEKRFEKLSEVGELKEIDEIAAVKGGKRLPKGAKFAEGRTAFPYISVKNFTDDGSIDPSKLRYLAPETQKAISRYIIGKDDLYISIAGTIGKTGIIPPELDGANLTENAARLIFVPEVLNEYVYYFSKTANFQEQVGLNTRTAAQPKLALVRLKTVKLPVVEISLQRDSISAFDEARSRCLDLEEQARSKLTDIADLRQSLLQKAFAGELT